jgi:flavin reductase (DIM6/NTAB) family NADH-FMN oxidoreductase RutF
MKRGVARIIAPMAGGDELRELMRLWPHGVSVLTVDYDGDRMGVTLSSLVSLSLEPPLVGISVGKQASCYELLRRAGGFAVSMLGSGQEEIARRFAAGRPPIVHWQGVATREGQIAPLIEGALGWIEARTVAEHDAGDHTFFVGAVLVAEQGPSTSALVYRDREYHAL